MGPLLLIGAALGGAAMYLFDPQQGRRRRARIMDKGVRAQTRTLHLVDKGKRDLANRAGSIGGRARSLFHRREPGDRVVAERVRARMGRYVAHPGAIEVSATRGCVVLTGSVLAHEHNELIAAIAEVPGVQDIYDRLNVFERAERISQLQGGRRRRGQRMELLQDNWGPAARVAAGAAGTVLAANVLRGGVKGWLYAAVGAALLVRAATNKPLTRERVEALLNVTGQSESSATMNDAAAPQNAETTL
ncbi:MAG TPA: BON domain-containing protein [Burkholderiales bacterium]|nr:BON domain-containing protein [Burkholderiales bacterium]